MTFQEEVLYILTAAHNHTGLSPQHAAELTRAIMQALRVRLPEAQQALREQGSRDLLSLLGDERA